MSDNRIDAATGEKMDSFYWSFDDWKHEVADLRTELDSLRAQLARAQEALKDAGEKLTSAAIVAADYVTADRTVGETNWRPLRDRLHESAAAVRAAISPNADSWLAEHDAKVRAECDSLLARVARVQEDYGEALRRMAEEWGKKDSTDVYASAWGWMGPSLQALSSPAADSWLAEKLAAAEAKGREEALRALKTEILTTSALPDLFPGHRDVVRFIDRALAKPSEPIP